MHNYCEQHSPKLPSSVTLRTRPCYPSIVRSSCMVAIDRLYLTCFRIWALPSILNYYFLIFNNFIVKYIWLKIYEFCSDFMLVRLTSTWKEVWNESMLLFYHIIDYFLLKLYTFNNKSDFPSSRMYRINTISYIIDIFMANLCTV